MRIGVAETKETKNENQTNWKWREKNEQKETKSAKVDVIKIYCLIIEK